MNKDKWIVLGYVGVDSGTLMISDPCYVDGDGWTEKDYDEWLVNKLCNQKKPFIRIKKGLNKHKAIIFNSGYGDGLYKVMARINADNRIMEVRILME